MWEPRRLMTRRVLLLSEVPSADLKRTELVLWGSRASNIASSAMAKFSLM